ncbi:lipopolysaccharide biosynthesis protein [Prosthecobacter sp.]|uniref:lipopolysaccharide biosynthesis protein n=1 Tax=Prosthecobacter sp. TaxID=1965333 RepID=UPI001DED3FC3|nr:lipopolysaccharide biosynthesis protein [Prosthecobacter sp.]MCB1277604.1 lipopolysaccharide biosynthesis protein [Prosthecobacter sp.]
MSNAAPDAGPERFLRTDHLHQDLKGRAVRGGVITLLAQGGKFAFQLINMVVLARLLSPDDFGLVGMVTSLVGFLTILKDLGLSAATIQRPEITHAQVSTLFWVNTGFGLLLALLTLAAAPLVVSFYHEPRLFVVICTLAAGFVVSGLSVQHQALLRRQMHFGTIMKIDLLALGCGTTAAVVAGCLGYGYWALVWSQLVLMGVTTISSWIACGWRPGTWHRNCGVGEMIGLGGWLAAFRMVSYWIQNVDNVLIGRFWGTQQLGYYMRAYQLLVMPLSQINLPIGEVTVPALSRMTDEARSYRDAYGKVLQMVLLLTLPVIVVTVGAADWVIEVVLGKQWISAAEIFMWLGIMAFAEPVRYTTSYLFISQGRTREMFFAELISSVFLIAAIAIGVVYSTKMVAICFAISSLLIRTPIVLYYVGRSGPVPTGYICKTAVPLILASLAALAALYGFRHSPLVSLPWINPFIGAVLATIITGVVFLLMLLLLPAGRSSLPGVRELLPMLRNRSKSKAT